MTSSPERPLLPSPECVVADPGMVAAKVADMHTRLFNAGQERMLAPQGSIYTLSKTTWTVEAGGITLKIEKEAPFSRIATIDDLRHNPFAVVMRTGQGRKTKFASLPFVQGESGQLPRGRQDYFCGLQGSETHMSEAQIAAGLQGVQAFLAGEIGAAREKNSRFIDIASLKEDGGLEASETTTKEGDSPARVVRTVKVNPPFGDLSFSFKARITQEAGTEIKYRDMRDYDGPFGVAIGQLVCVYAFKRDLLGQFIPLRQVIPSTNARIVYLPERLARDQSIDATRGVLTVGRFHKVAAQAARALERLAGYHEAYQQEYGLYRPGHEGTS